MSNTAEAIEPNNEAELANTQATETNAELQIDAQQVADWLMENSDFLTQNPELLRKLELDGEKATGLSLHARQLTALRERIIELEEKQAELLDVLQNNEAVAQRLHKLLISLSECKSERQLFIELERSMKQDFAVDFYQWHSAGSLSENIPNELHKLSKKTSALMGRLNKPVMLACFGQDVEAVKSACVLSLHYNGQFLGLLTLGSKDQLRFTDRPGTALLERFGALLGGVLGSKRSQE